MRTEKVYVPVDEHPDVIICFVLFFVFKITVKHIVTIIKYLFSTFQFNFVGRILGPRGMTAKQLELETGCKIMVRGKGSMRDKKKASKTYLKFSF